MLLLLFMESLASVAHSFDQPSLPPPLFQSGTTADLSEHRRVHPKNLFFHPVTAVAGRKINLFARTQPWEVEKTIFSSGHRHGWPEKQSFCQHTAVAGRKNVFFARTRLWQGEKTVIFTKNAHFPPKHSILTPNS
jgi:hypothetical protein